MTAKRIVIEGRVQGVGCRFFTETLAATEGLHGWARNLADGRVVDDMASPTAEQVLDRMRRFDARGRVA